MMRKMSRINPVRYRRRGTYVFSGIFILKPHFEIIKIGQND
jgi:hypothetical protein